MRTVGVAARWVAHPVTLVAAGILLLNDRLGKSLWPGPVTGKVSDVAGLIVAPAALSVLVALLVPRGSVRLVGGVALAATGTGFVLAKVTATGNALAVAGWQQVAGSAQVVRDPTDLLALPAVLVAALACRTVAVRTLARGPVSAPSRPRRPAAGGGAVRRPADGGADDPAAPGGVSVDPAAPGGVRVGSVAAGGVRVGRGAAGGVGARRSVVGGAAVPRAGAAGAAVRRVTSFAAADVGRFARWRRSGWARTAARWAGALLGGPLVLVALAGTSVAPRSSVTRLLADGDRVVVAGGAIRPAIGTPDGGWRRLGAADARRLGVDRNRTELPPAHTLACVPGSTGHCFRIPGAPGYSEAGGPPRGGRNLWVQETLDGGTGWRTVWQVPPERWEFLRRSHGLTGSDDRLLASADILVRPVAGGYQVVVANGVDGLAVRDPDGGWRRVAVRLPETSALTPLPLTGFAMGITGRLMPAPLTALLGTLTALLAMVIRRNQLAPRSVSGGVISVLVSTGVGGLLIGAMVLAVADFLQAWQLIVAFEVAVVGGTAAAALAQGAVPRRRAWLLILVPVVVGAGYAAPYVGWSLGVPAAMHTASLFAFAAAMDGLIASAALGWWLGDTPVRSAAVDVPAGYRREG